MTFQPIETAPRDGTVILLDVDGDACVGWYDADAPEWKWRFIDYPKDFLLIDDARDLVEVNGDQDDNEYVNGWMPMPKPEGRE